MVRDILVAVSIVLIFPFLLVFIAAGTEQLMKDYDSQSDSEVHNNDHVSVYT